MNVVCFDLYHDGEQWIAKNGELTVTGKTLRELDQNIKNELKRMYETEDVIKVTMELDYRRNIPHWIWQYHPYYFYRTVYMKLR